MPREHARNCRRSGAHQLFLGLGRASPTGAQDGLTGLKQAPIRPVGPPVAAGAVMLAGEDEQGTRCRCGS